MLPFFTTSMPHNAHTFKACGEMMSGWQDSGIATCWQPVASRSPISHRLVAENFTAKVFMKLVDDKLATVRRLVGD